MTNNVKSVEVTKAKSFIIEDNILVKYIGSDKNIIIPNGVTRIGDYAFEDCTTLISVIIPISVTSIGNYAFLGCTNLTHIDINSVTHISNHAFDGCKNLVTITIPDGLISMGKDVIKFYSSLETIIIPNSAVSMDRTSLCIPTSITVPDNVKNIAFEWHTRNLTDDNNS